MPLDISLDDQEVFRDSYNVDDAVLNRTAPKFYHFPLRGNDVIYDTQSLDKGAYVVVPGLTFEAFLLDNEIPMVASRSLINGVPLNRIEADPQGLQKIVTWIGEQAEAVRVPEKARR